MTKKIALGQTAMSSAIDKYAESKNVPVRCFMALAPDKRPVEYVLFDAGKPIYAATSAEAIGAHIDMIWAARLFDGVQTRN